MKNKYMMGALLFGIISLFASCSDDNDSNPTLIQPTEFKLNTPEYANGFIDLEKSKELNFTWSQPKYTVDNAPLNVTYEIQVSPKNSFTVSTDEAAADESGEKVADYDILSPTTQYCNATISAEEIDKSLVRVLKFKENEVPAELEVGIRINAYIVEGNKRLNPVISNVVTLKAKPYFVELKDATPIMWYLVGNMFGGKWGDKKESIGDQSLPMFLKPNFRYDKKTGTGEIEYTNYFLTDNFTGKESALAGFKIQSDFDWGHSMDGGSGTDDGNYDKIVYRGSTDYDGGHILASAAGYYTITLNTANNTATMVKYEGTITDYGTIQITGTFNDGADTPMLPYNTEGVENHAWYYIMEVPAGETVQFKFKTADGKSWGYGATNGAINMYGKCESGGNNIGLEAGKYVISFNDITGSFSIVKL